MESRALSSGAAPAAAIPLCHPYLENLDRRGSNSLPPSTTSLGIFDTSHFVHKKWKTYTCLSTVGYFKFWSLAREQLLGAILNNTRDGKMEAPLGYYVVLLTRCSDEGDVRRPPNTRLRLYHQDASRVGTLTGRNVTQCTSGARQSPICLVVWRDVRQASARSTSLWLK